MPKMKTNQAIAKRYKVKKSGKIQKKAAGQGHFNAREDGKTGRQKRGGVVVSQTLRKVMAAAMVK
ncbi:MAG: hypothetical protein A2538_02180 [Candidatus Magasanikbacteria bacterium RIFOXYD2_FULL_41_14]|uniref:Large ribosomal subunit protein bL35 n=1 Tax=Candidatus Magasanikbacteria bacterium RIFOXYD2_FULL_41_14 TaxID=1798709 RepID=A0A1F6PDF8_9BACT|nr:MAG: hypothetical protein A2538_02180 [Candidatus Magasanikbacteria bacterium RIFOXYD2_FULL_41_14]